MNFRQRYLGNSFLLVLLLFAVGVCVSVVPADAITSRSSYWGTAARGMGGAYTAAAGNFSGISYNPANSASMQGGQFVSDFNQLSQNSVDVRNGAIGGATRYGSWVHGLAFNRTDLSHDFGNFSTTSSGLNLDYSDDIYYYNSAWNITPEIHVAGNVKYFKVNTSVEDGNASGYGLDLGYMHFLGDRTTLGVSVKNLVGSKDWSSGTSEDVPMDIRAGLRYRLFSDAAAEIDAVYGQDPGLRSFNIGGEWWIWKRFKQTSQPLRRPYFRYMQRQAPDRIQFGLALRGGVEIETAGSENTNLSLGLGMQFGSGQLDYAFQQVSDFENQHFFGFSTSFGGATDSSEIVRGDQSSTMRNNQSDQYAQQTQQDQSRRQLPGENSFMGSEVSVGLLQWQSDPEIRMRTDMLRDNLSRQSGLNLSVYDQNSTIEEALINDSLSDFQKRRLIEETGHDYLVTGELRTNRGRYSASIVIESPDGRETFQLSGESGGEILNAISERILEYLQQEQRAENVEEENGRQQLPVPYSVRIGLLQWNTDGNVPFQPEELEQHFEQNRGFEATVYRRNNQLEQSILHNALSGQQTAQLLNNVDKDYLLTGQITRVGDGYLATAYLVNQENRESINVMHSDLNELVTTISQRIQQRVSS